MLMRGTAVVPVPLLPALQPSCGPGPSAEAHRRSPRAQHLTRVSGPRVSGSAHGWRPCPRRFLALRGSAAALTIHVRPPVRCDSALILGRTRFCVSCVGCVGVRSASIVSVPGSHRASSGRRRGSRPSLRALLRASQLGVVEQPSRTGAACESPARSSCPGTALGGLRNGGEGGRETTTELRALRPGRPPPTLSPSDCSSPGRAAGGARHAGHCGHGQQPGRHPHRLCRETRGRGSRAPPRSPRVHSDPLPASPFTGFRLWHVTSPSPHSLP